MFKFAVVVACAFAQFCYGMYEDQIGEYDWSIENIGFVEHTIYVVFIASCPVLVIITYQCQLKYM
jgi:hypothetical protein